MSQNEFGVLSTVLHIHVPHVGPLKLTIQTQWK